jgi:hypothetical protein
VRIGGREVFQQIAQILNSQLASHKITRGIDCSAGTKATDKSPIFGKRALR